MKARRALLIGSVSFFTLTLALAGTAHAQDEADAAAEEEAGDEGGDAADGADEATSDEGPAEDTEESEASEEGAKDEGAGTEEAAAGAASPAELPGKSYKFVGLRYRGIMVPQFMINLFGEGGNGVYVHAFGPEFAIRRDNFEYNFSIWYADYSMDPTTFKAKDDPDDAWEIVESQLKVLYFTADFLWSHDFNPQFAVNYGMGAGIGLVFGDLYRQQAKPGTPGAPPEDWVACEPSDRGVVLPYCGTDNDHYGDYSEKSWASGGSKPIVFPWLALQTGLRYKPHPKFVARLDLGFGTSGFFFGLGADYGL